MKHRIKMRLYIPKTFKENLVNTEYIMPGFNACDTSTVWNNDNGTGNDVKSNSPFKIDSQFREFSSFNVLYNSGKVSCV